MGSRKVIAGIFVVLVAIGFAVGFGYAAGGNGDFGYKSFNSNRVRRIVRHRSGGLFEADGKTIRGEIKINRQYETIMLKTRLWMGALLIGLAAPILLEERWLAPWYPFLFLATASACLLGTRELLSMLDSASRPFAPLCYVGVLAIVLANWRVPLVSVGILPASIGVWHLIGLIFVAVGIAVFLIEMRRFHGPDRIVERVVQTLLVVFYLGVLPSFLLQLCWLDAGTITGYPSRATLSIALTVFVPKCGDIGAYFTGKFLTGGIIGRNHMTPILSPKKTWQGLAGGLIVCVVVAIGICSAAEVLPGGTLVAIAFGLTVGIAGVFGDLAESLIKRDRQTKDASSAVPGFGGVLDVIDSLLFAAPVAYLWLA